MFKNYVFKAEAGKVFSALAARGGLFVTVMLFAGLIHAQQPPLTFVYEPDAWDIGDTVSIEFVYGSAQNPISPENEFHLIHDYSGLEYAIDPESIITVDTTASWICGDCTIDIWVDHELQKIHVWISRDDEEEVGGYGTVFVLRGIITVIDDLHRKANPYLSVNSQSEISVNYENRKLFISQLGASTLEIRLTDIASGRIVLSQNFQGENAKVDTEKLAPGVYGLIVRSPDKFIARKFVIR